MFGYYKFFVSNSPAGHPDADGYRVPGGAKAKCPNDAIRHDVSQDRTARRGGFAHCLALLLAASTAFVLVGIPGASARVQSDMFSDADGIEPPGMGLAYDKSAAYKAYLQRQRQRKHSVAAHSDGERDGPQKVSHHKAGGNQSS